jgi:hypothetical protein
VVGTCSVLRISSMRLRILSSSSAINTFVFRFSKSMMVSL